MWAKGNYPSQHKEIQAMAQIVNDVHAGIFEDGDQDQIKSGEKTCDDLLSPSPNTFPQGAGQQKRETETDNCSNTLVIFFRSQNPCRHTVVLGCPKG